MAKNILAQHGFQKLYLGFFPTVIRESIGLACYFGVYDGLSRNFIKHDGKVHLLGSLLCGAIAGVGFWTLNYPVDYIKTIIQADSLEQPKYKGSWHCVK